MINPGKYKSRITLITEKLSESGDVEQQKVVVWAEKKSITRTEFYASFQAGLSPNIAFQVRAGAYKLSCVTDEDHTKRYASSVIFGGGKYSVIRAYETDDVVEIICG